MADILKTTTISVDIVHLRPSLTGLEVNVASNNDVVPAAKTNNNALSDIKKLARDAGYKAGLKEGLTKGLLQANAQITEHVNTLNLLIQNIPVAISDTRLQLSKDIADIVLGIAQQLFIHQQQNKEAIGLQITQTITQLNDKQNIELFLHPHDLALLERGEVKVNLKQCKNLRVTPDESLRLGGCIVRSEHGVFDASIERQIDRLKTVLLKMKHGELCE